MQSPPIYTDSVASRNKSFHLFMYIQNIFKLSILSLANNNPPSSEPDPRGVQPGRTLGKSNQRLLMFSPSHTNTAHTQGTMKRTLITHKYEHVKLSSPHRLIKSTVQKKQKKQTRAGAWETLLYTVSWRRRIISSLSSQSSSSQLPILAKSSFSSSPVMTSTKHHATYDSFSNHFLMSRAT